MTSNDLISIVIPVYNTRKYLKKCINSVLTQTYSNLEIVVVDDGSTDDSLELIKKLSKNDTRIKIISQKNGGLSSARNTGIKIARGEYIIFVDSDDYVEKDFVEVLYKTAKKHDAMIAVCNFVNEPNHKDHKSFNNICSGLYAAVRLLTKQENYDVVAWNKIYNAKLVRKIKFPIGLNNEDNFTTYKLYSEANKVVSIKRPLYHYCTRTGSIMSQKSNKHLENKKLASIKAQEYFSNKIKNLEKKSKAEIENNSEIQNIFLEYKTLIKAAEYSELLAELQIIDNAILNTKSKNSFETHRKFILDNLSKWKENPFLDYKRKIYLRLLNTTDGEKYVTLKQRIYSSK